MTTIVNQHARARRPDDRSVLVVDDEVSLAKMIARDLKRHGYDVTVAHSVEAAKTLLKARPVKFAIVDLMLPDGDGSEIVEWALRNEFVEVACVMTAAAECRNVVRAMQNGSTTVFEKPVRVGDLRDFMDAHREAQQDDLAIWRQSCAPDVCGNDPLLLEQLQVSQQIAPSDCTVLVTGETGTGKELFARAVHLGSERHAGPYVALNCAAVPESLIEDELFGHTAGAFTGANQVRGGRIAAADGGTLFLDEIGDMPLPAQSKLLRFLEDGTIIPVGADLPIEVDVRIVAATNRDLDAMSLDGRFRADLLYRLNIIQLTLPPLRDRPGDILPLAQRFLLQETRRHRKGLRHLSAAAEARLVEHHWPGNVRELKNTIERAVLTCVGEFIDARVLRISSKTLRPIAPLPPAPVVPMAGPMAAPAPVTAIPVAASAPVIAAFAPVVATLGPASGAQVVADLPEGEGGQCMDLKAALKNREQELITVALEQTGGNRTEAAALLGLNRTTLVEKIRKGRK